MNLVMMKIPWKTKLKFMSKQKESNPTLINKVISERKVLETFPLHKTTYKAIKSFRKLSKRSVVRDQIKEKAIIHRYGVKIKRI